MVKSNLNVGFDVDGTLLLFKYPKEYEHLAINIERDGEIVKAVPNWKMIEKIKEEYVRGHIVWVHSAGGYEWAERVVKLLNLEKYVRWENIQCKIRWLFDDEKPEQWVNTYYINPFEDDKK